MSDHGRQSLHDKIGHALQPNATKTSAESAGDKIANKLDHAASRAQPQENKSASQKIADALTPGASNRRAI